MAKPVQDTVQHVNAHIERAVPRMSVPVAQVGNFRFLSGSFHTDPLLAHVTTLG
jgi:hypothetical protein